MALSLGLHLVFSSSLSALDHFEPCFSDGSCSFFALDCSLKFLDMIRVHVEHRTFFFLFFVVLDLDRLLDFGFWTRFGDNVEPRTLFFLWITWTGFWLRGFSVRQGSTPWRVW